MGGSCWGSGTRAGSIRVFRCAQYGDPRLENRETWGTQNVHLEKPETWGTQNVHLEKRETRGTRCFGNSYG